MEHAQQAPPAEAPCIECGEVVSLGGDSPMAAIVWQLVATFARELHRRRQASLRPGELVRCHSCYLQHRLSLERETREQWEDLQLAVRDLRERGRVAPDLEMRVLRGGFGGLYKDVKDELRRRAQSGGGGSLR